ncbi:hypothetical protein [Porphyromonas gingivicanis]|uniref:hypothetical protein n=1 Tax=Porphyromonas gingivicanis TaxID=266762 RepID=UPI0011DCA8D3|nr:hypothetical protein [Porphyromonas gingivicanis]
MVRVPCCSRLKNAPHASRRFASADAWLSRRWIVRLDAPLRSPSSVDACLSHRWIVRLDAPFRSLALADAWLPRRWIVRLDAPLRSLALADAWLSRRHIARWGAPPFFLGGRRGENAPQCGKSEGYWVTCQRTDPFAQKGPCKVPKPSVQTPLGHIGWCR